MKIIRLLSIIHYLLKRIRRHSQIFSVCHELGKEEQMFIGFLGEILVPCETSHVYRAFEFGVMRSVTESRSSLMFELTNVECCGERYGVLWSPT